MSVLTSALTLTKPSIAALSLLAGVVLTIGVFRSVPSSTPDLAPGCVLGYVGSMHNGVPLMLPVVVCTEAAPAPKAKINET